LAAGRAPKNSGLGPVASLFSIRRLTPTSLSRLFLQAGDRERSLKGEAKWTTLWHLERSKHVVSPNGSVSSAQAGLQFMGYSFESSQAATGARRVPAQCAAVISSCKKMRANNTVSKG
jgi:hypothetical protein